MGETKSTRGSPSLLECIGFPASSRLFIINCDDLGCSRSSNQAIVRALNEGLASSATLMVPCPSAQEAAKQCRGLDIGVHLTLNSEYPAYRWRSLTGAASLSDKDGFLPRTVDEVWAHADLDDVERECRAQIDRALDWGVDVTHLDSHMDTLQMNGAYFRVYMSLAARYRLPVRLRRSGFSPTTSYCRVLLERRGIVTTDHFASAPWGEVAKPTLLKSIRKAAKGVTEFVLHPVEASEELFEYDSENAEVRVADAECLMDKEVRALLASTGVTLIGYRPLREAMRRHETS